MTERFKRAYDLLVKAYFNGTLRAGDCTACAVGNICGGNPEWKALFVTLSKTNQHKRFWEEYEVRALYKLSISEIKEIVEELTDYSESELAKIEFTFETNTKFDHEEYYSLSESEILADQFNGLKAVVELMMSFDGIEGDQYVDKFKEKLQTV